MENSFMFKTFWHYASKKRWLLIVAPLIVIIEVVAELQQPNFLAQIVNSYQNSAASSIVWQVGLKMTAFLVLSLLASLGSVYTSNLVASFFGRNIRKDLFAKVQSLSLSQIENMTPGSLLTRLTNDVNQMQNLLVQVLRMAVRAPLMFIGSLIFLSAINIQLLLVTLALTPVILLIVVIVAKFALPLFRQLQKKFDELNNQMSESLSGIRTIKSFNREQLEINKFTDINETLSQNATKSNEIMATAMPLMMFVLNLATALVLWKGSALISIGNLEIGSLIAAIGYLTQLLFSFLMISFIFLSFMRAKVSVERIKEIINIKPDLLISDHPTDKKIIHGKIRFEEVTFAYQKNANPVLCNFNLEIAASETIGFIGTTGSGKTTLALLLSRLYDPSEGRIFIDDQDMRDYPADEIKNKIAIVLQEAILLSGTIQENLTWGEQITHEKLSQALSIAQAESFIAEKPEQLLSRVERRGSNFSGGQKQRLSLARALTRDFRILILDDTTSALDMKTAALVHQALINKVGDATKIIISQRINSVKSCDRIVVLNNGELNGCGTHEELLSSNAIYQRINQIQKEDE